MPPSLQSPLKLHPNLNVIAQSTAEAEYVAALLLLGTKLFGSESS
jgi:hypothetical protein